MNDREVMQKALDALENSSYLVFEDISKSHLRKAAIQALRAATAQPEQIKSGWNELNDADRQQVFESLPDMFDGFLKTWGWLHFAKGIEAKCREKNIAQPEQTVEPVAWQWLDTGTFRKTLPKTAVVADWNPLFKNFSTIAQPEQPAPKDVKDAQRYRRIRNGPHSDQYGDLYAMTFQGNGDVPLNGKELDRIVDAALAIAQPEQTTNFCSRCGKLVVASHDSHTCTPPVGHTN